MSSCSQTVAPLWDGLVDSVFPTSYDVGSVLETQNSALKLLKWKHRFLRLSLVAVLFPDFVSNSVVPLVRFTAPWLVTYLVEKYRLV